jgi:hypothetical protein
MKPALSKVRENTPFATPPRVLVVADEGCAGQAIRLADVLDGAGAEAAVRFAEDAGHRSFQNIEPDAVIVAGRRGYRVERHHAILENLTPFAAG